MEVHATPHNWGETLEQALLLLCDGGGGKQSSERLKGLVKPLCGVTDQLMRTSPFRNAFSVLLRRHSYPLAAIVYIGVSSYTRRWLHAC